MKLHSLYGCPPWCRGQGRGNLPHGVVLSQTLEMGIVLEVDIEPSDTAVRARNMRLGIHKFYSDSLNQMLMPSSPRDVALIPPTHSSLHQMENLLLLLLGAAVQSDHKQDIAIAMKILTLVSGQLSSF
jgi:hypothetical protein